MSAAPLDGSNNDEEQLIVNVIQDCVQRPARVVYEEENEDEPILLWAKPEADTCRSPYEWACGRFEEKYIAHSLFGANKGEWNFDANRDYEETTAAYEFISKLPSVAVTYSTQAMLKRLHSICTTVETVSSNEVITSLKRALNDLVKS
ncbi:hypothetical protein RP20_CCG010530 [Aedes albopictus]|nr:hypothetical protein RP20_CCG010530 [Aedes albopictus]